MAWRASCASTLPFWSAKSTSWSTRGLSNYTHYRMSPIDSAAISRSRMVTFLRSSRAMPCAGPVSLAVAGVPSALLHALTHQPTFGNKLVAFLCGDAVARSGNCIQLDGGHASSVFVAALSCSINSLKVIARLPFFFSSLKAGAHFSNSTISPSKMDCCFLSSRAMPWLSGGDRRRSSTLASSWRFLSSVFWVSSARL